MLDQIAVHEHAARQHNRAHAVHRFDDLGHFDDCAHDGFVEAAGDGARGHPRFDVVEQGAEDGFGVELEHRRVEGRALLRCHVLHDAHVVAVERFGVNGGGLVDRGLEQDCALPFVGRLFADAQQGARRIEKAADRRGKGAVQPPVDHLLADGRGVAQAAGQPLALGMVEQIERPQQTPGAPQGMLDRSGSSRQGEVGKVGETLVGRKVGKHDLTAPDGPVFAVARAVEGESAHGPFELVFGHGRRQVGVMVLHFGHGKALGVGQLAREVFGMLVADHAHGIELEEPFVDAFGPQPGVVGGRVFHIADVLAHEGLAGAREREGILLFGAGGEQHGRVFPAGHRKRHHRRRETAGAPNHLHARPPLSEVEHAQDRIVVARQDRPVVAQKGVGDPGKGPVGAGVVDLDGLVVHVAARHHEEARIVVHDQVLQGGRRQHDAQFGKAIGQTGREDRIGTLLEQHDGARGALKLLGLFLAHLAVGPRRFNRRHHAGEGLARATLATAQFGQSKRVGGVAGQMEAAESLDGHDRTRAQLVDAGRDNRVALVARGAPAHLPGCMQVACGGGGAGGFFGKARLAGPHRGHVPAQVRTAFKAGVGLGVEAAVGRVDVFGRAGAAHGKVGHACCGPVVGQAADNREARAAVGAVDEGVAVAAVGRVEELADAIVAGGQVGRYEGRLFGCGVVGIADLEIGEAFQGHFGHRDLLHAGGGGRLFGNSHHEFVDVLFLAFGMDMHAVDAV